MKKIITIILTFAMLASLAGCSAENSPSDANNSSDISNSADSSSNAVSDTSSDENSEPAESAPEEDKGEATFLLGPDEKPVYSNEISTFLDIDRRTEITVENIAPEKFYYAVCDGFCYLSEPSGISSSELTNPDRWNGALNCVDVPRGLIPEYKKLYVGDTICGLTIKKASSEFSGSKTDNFNRSYVEFDGELTLTGYITVNYDGQYHVADGDLQFLIDDKSAILPGSCDKSSGYSLFSYNGFYLDDGTSDPDWYWSVSEYGLICLGNVNTVTADISDIGSRDMCYYKVKVKINNLKIGYYPEMSNGEYRYFADLVKLEAID